MNAWTRVAAMKIKKKQERVFCWMCSNCQEGWGNRYKNSFTSTILKHLNRKNSIKLGQMPNYLWVSTRMHIKKKIHGALNKQIHAWAPLECTEWFLQEPGKEPGCRGGEVCTSCKVGTENHCPKLSIGSIHKGQQMPSRRTCLTSSNEARAGPLQTHQEWNSGELWKWSRLIIISFTYS